MALELEVLAKKFDRFGWERDRGTAAQDRLIADWMDALHDYPLDEVREACRRCVMQSPSRMPNEGHIAAAILDQRRLIAKPMPKRTPPEPPKKPRMSQEAAAEILARAGFSAKSFRDGDKHG